MKCSFNLILVLWMTKTLTFTHAANMTKDITTNVLKPEVSSTTLKPEKISETPSDLIKQIMAARTTMSTTTSTQRTPMVEPILAQKKTDKESNFQEPPKPERNDLDKIKIEGITIEEILKRCKDNNEKSRVPNLNFDSQRPNPNFPDQNQIVNYIASLQQANSPEAQNQFLQNINLNDPIKNSNMGDSNVNFFQSYYSDLINRYYTNKVETNKVPSAPIKIQQDQQTKPPQATIQQPSLQPVKMVPTVLQKVILKDGQIVYYLPRNQHSFSHGVNNNEYQQRPSSNTHIVSYDYQGQASSTTNQAVQNKPEDKFHVPSFYPLPVGSLPNGYAIPTDNRTQSKVPDAAPKPNINILPNYEIKYINPTPRPSATTTKSLPVVINYDKQLKFVMPYRGCKDDVPTRYADQIDPYAYLGKAMQPSEINLKVPYTPVFHVIKSLKIPDNLGNVEINENDGIIRN